MLPEFNSRRPGKLGEALDLLSKGKYSIIAGGTDSLVRLRMKPVIDYDIMDISGLDEIRYIRQEGDNIRIGSLATFAQIIESQLIEESAPLLKKAASQTGSIQIRNRATIGGNICNASISADCLNALVCLGANVRLISKCSERSVRIEDFVTGPNTTLIKEGEILESVVFKSMSPEQVYCFYKLGTGNANTLSKLNTAVILEIAGGRVISSSVSAGCVFPTPVRLYDVEGIINGKRISVDLFREAGERASQLISEDTDASSDSDYDKAVLKTVVRRALEIAAGRELE
jgi:CO/xanthine dehydrogenase FAD-binding subunit